MITVILTKNKERKLIAEFCGFVEIVRPGRILALPPSHWVLGRLWSAKNVGPLSAQPQDPSLPSKGAQHADRKPWLK